MATAANEQPEFPDLILANLARAYAGSAEPPSRFEQLLERLAERHRAGHDEKSPPERDQH